MFVVALVAVGLLVGGLLLARIRVVPGQHDAGSGGAAEAQVSVIVPARDEEMNLPLLLTSLAAQRPPVHEVIVVDDDSTDATASVAASMGVNVVPAGTAPPGWAGKPWACWTGAQRASGETLLFLDADTVLAVDGVTRLVRAHRTDASDGLLSVQPRHRTRRLYEQLSAFPNVVSMMGTGAFAIRPRHRRATRPMAFGPCLVTDRAAYTAIGGHAAVRGQVVEDVHLARAYADAGRTVRCLGGGSAVWFRMYPHGAGALAEGWTKNLAEGSRLAPTGPALGAAAWVAACAAAAVGTVSAVVSWSNGGTLGWWPVTWLAVSLELAWMLRRIGTFQWWTAVLFPIPLAAFMALFARSAYVRLARRPVRWRGRSLEQVRHP